MVSFGKVTEEERQHIYQLQAAKTAADQNMKELFKIQTNINYQVSEFWIKIGKKYDIDPATMPYTISRDGNIVLGDREVV